MLPNANSKAENGAFFAQCRLCGRWREVQARPVGADSFFTFWQAEFQCCKTPQAAYFTLEKEDDDVH